jgi:hypothetical protein
MAQWQTTRHSANTGTARTSHAVSNCLGVVGGLLSVAYMKSDIDSVA